VGYFVLARCHYGSTTTALILVDAQRNVLEGEEPVRGAAEVRPALERLLASARACGATVIHVHNDGQPSDPDEPETEGWELVFRSVGDELVVRKSEPNAFGSNPQLAQVLRDEGVDRVATAGMQSEFCVQGTSLGAISEGFEVSVPRGAHATYGATSSEAVALLASVEQELEAEGVQVVDLAVVDF
jgi:streptothricin hydrolase